MSNLELNEQLLMFLLQELKKNPDLKFGVRVKNNKGRLEQGQWFQGDGKYTFVSFYNRGDAKNKTKTIGFAFTVNMDGTVSNAVVLVYPDETDPGLISFYKEVKQLIVQKCNISVSQEEIDRTRNDFELPGNYLDNFRFFCEELKPAIDQLIIDHGFESLFFYTDEEFRQNLDRVLRYRELIKQQPNSNIVKTGNKFPLNQILYGPPGTGKTYNTKALAVSIADPDFTLNPDWDDQKKRQEINKAYDTLFKAGQIVFTTFHQSMSYEDFVEGIKPKTVNDKVLYEIEDGVFKQLCNKASVKAGNFDMVIERFKNEISESDGKQPLTIRHGNGNSFDVIYRGTSVFYAQPKNSSKQNVWYPVNINNMRVAFETGEYGNLYNPTYIREILNYLKSHNGLVLGKSGELKNYVLIIDEINRGNVSAIFGELITLLEPDKRSGEKEELKVKLSYSKSDFTVPSNLYIIGTMNTGDRSVEALDTALRRRFSFTEMTPKPEKLVGIKFDGFSLKTVLEVINQRIEALLDRDHAIGHSYFININSTDTVALKNAFKNCIIPLLQEYFYHDYEKIALVLGRGFVSIKKPEENPVTFAIKSQNQPDRATTYSIIDDVADIEIAVRELLNPTWKVDATA